VAAEIERRLRLGTPAVIARIADGSVLIDVRTIFPNEDEQVVAAVRAATS
jgi:L-seryl-tRNA(Ser) seleniumtransferase